MKRSDPPDAGHAAIDLLRRWQAHELGGVYNTLFAVFGVASPAGRFADKFALSGMARGYCLRSWGRGSSATRGVAARSSAFARRRCDGRARLVERGRSARCHDGRGADGIARVLPGKDRSPQRDQGRCGGQQPAHAGAASPWRMRGTRSSGSEVLRPRRPPPHDRQRNAAVLSHRRRMRDGHANGLERDAPGARKGRAAGAATCCGLNCRKSR